MISRIWHGWTTTENADAYEALLNEEIFVGIKKREIQGFIDIQLLRRSVGDEVEFITIMRFESIDAIREFAGDDYEVCVVPPNARKVLKRFDKRSQHYEVKITEDGAHVRRRFEGGHAKSFVPIKSAVGYLLKKRMKRCCANG